MNHSTDSHPDQRAGITVGTVTYLVWGLLTVYWKQLTGFDAFELIGWRVSLGAITMAIGLTITRRWGNLRPLRTDRALVRNTAAAALLLTVNWTSYVWAVVHGHVLETALGYFIAPIGTVLVGVLVLREPLVAAQRVALALAVAAVLVLSLSYGEVPVIALLLAVSWVVYGYLKKKVPLGPVESMAAESFVLAVPAVAAVALSRQFDPYNGWGLIASSALPWVALAGWPLWVTARKGNGGRIDLGLQMTRAQLRVAVTAGFVAYAVGLIGAWVTTRLRGDFTSTAGDVGSRQQGLV